MQNNKNLGMETAKTTIYCDMEDCKNNIIGFCQLKVVSLVFSEGICENFMNKYNYEH